MSIRLVILTLCYLPLTLTYASSFSQLTQKVGREAELDTKTLVISSHATIANKKIQARKKQQKRKEKKEKIVSNPDDKRPDDQFTTRLFGRDLVIGGEYEIRAEQRGNYALSDKDNDREGYRHKLELEFKYDMSEHVKALVETKLISSANHRVNRKSHLNTLERGESWLDFSRPVDDKVMVGIRIGRQNFAEKREWWWDEDLDAVRVYYTSPKLSYELGVAEEQGGRAANQPLPETKKDIQRVLGRLKWEYSKGHKFEVFALSHDDQSSSPQVGDAIAADLEDTIDAQLNWYGMRLRGKDKIKDVGKIRYWADLGMVRGDETILGFNDISPEQVEVTERSRKIVKGSAFDVGFTVKSKLKGCPSFTLSLAQGSGDDNPTDHVDRSFRQTGINDNNSKFNGVDSFRYYGELLRPQLSNIRISTVSAGIPLRHSSSLEIVYHHYNQVEVSKKISSRLRRRATGKNGSIGDEIDLVLGLEEWKKLELEFVASIFRAGKAFGDSSGDFSHFVGAKVNYNF